MSTIKFEDIKLMLLGSARPDLLQHRKTIREELLSLGYKEIIIMEDVDHDITDKSLDYKFSRITNKVIPDMFVAIYHKDAKVDGIAFEIGWLCCKFDFKQLHQKLRILHEEDYDWKKTTAYISDLFSSVPHRPYDDSKDYSKASMCIHQFVLQSLP